MTSQSSSCVLLLLATTLAPTRLLDADPAAPTIVPAAKLQADVTLLRQAFETLHPGLLRYQTPEQASASFSELERALAQDRPLSEVFLEVAAFTAKIRCGHTYPNFFNQSDAVAAELFAPRPRLPFHFRWLGGEMVVTRSFAPDLPSLVPGSVISAIAGIPVEKILERLLPLARADGGNDAVRLRQLEVRGESRYEAFDIYFPLAFPELGRAVQVTFRAPGGEVATVPVAMLTDDDRRRAYEADRGAAERPGSPSPWSLRFLDERTALFTMPDWVTYQFPNWDWKAEIRGYFDEILRQGAKVLVIDLRGNEGGTTEVATEMLRALATTPIVLRPQVRKVRYRKIPAALKPHLDTWDRSFDDWGDAAVDVGGGYFELRNAAAIPDRLDPVETPFRGQVFVLVGAANSSATFLFAREVAAHGLGRLVGQPTGGNQRGINGSAFYFLRLPGSGLAVDLPLVGTFAPDERPDGGQLPDLPVTATAADIAADRDVELAAALAASGGEP